jgi:hypothetical protein
MAELYLSLGFHGSIDEGLVAISEAQAEGVLANCLARTDGQVVLCVENPAVPLAAAEAVSSQSKLGYRPVEAFARGIMIGRLGRVIDASDTQAYAEFIQRYVWPHLGAVALGDGFWDQYPGRVRIMTEGVPPEEIDTRYAANGERYADIEYQAAKRDAMNGQFDSAAMHFRRSAQDTAGFADARELLLVSRLVSEANDPEVSAEVVQMGLMHRIMERALAAAGCDVTSIEVRDDNGELYAKTPYDRAVESYRSAGTPMSKLALYQAVVGELMLETLNVLDHSSSGSIHLNANIAMVHDVVADALKDMKHVRRFERKIRAAIKAGDNFIKVFESL